MKVLYVAARPLIDPPIAQTLPEDVLAHLQRNACYAIDKALAQFDTDAEALLAIEGGILSGQPQAIILDEAEKWEADLIVLGLHGMSGAEQLLLGSVSQAVVVHARCSVEIVRSHFGSERQPVSPTRKTQY